MSAVRIRRGDVLAIVTRETSTAVHGPTTAREREGVYVVAHATRDGRARVVREVRPAWTSHDGAATFPPSLAPEVPTSRLARVVRVHVIGAVLMTEGSDVHRAYLALGFRAQYGAQPDLATPLAPTPRAFGPDVLA